MKPGLWVTLLVVGSCGGDVAPGTSRAVESPAEGEARSQSWSAEALRARFPTPPGRIVSLVPSFSQTLLALGLKESLVGRTDFDTLSALSRLPSVGTGLQPSVEAVVSLQPDLVLGFAGPSDPGIASRLEDMGIAFVGLRADGIQEVFQVTRLLGVLTHQDARADSLVLHMTRALDEVRRRNARLPRIRAAILIGGTPPWVAGPGSYLDELLDIAGGDNAFADLEVPFGSISPEVLATREIDLILANAGTPTPLGLSAIPRADLPAGIEVPGPGMVDAARSLALILHPEAPR